MARLLSRFIGLISLTAALTYFIYDGATSFMKSDCANQQRGLNLGEYPQKLACMAAASHRASRRHLARRHPALLFLSSQSGWCSPLSERF